MRKRTQPDRSVTRRVTLLVSGKTQKVIRRRMTLNAAVREIGGDPVNTEGRMLGGIPWSRERTLCKGVKVRLTYVCDPRPRPGVIETRLLGLNARDAVLVARTGGAL